MMGPEKVVRNVLASMRQKAVFIIFASIILIHFIHFFPPQIQAGDNAYKVRQAIDFLRSGFKSTEVDYPGKQITGDYRFFPTVFPHFHVIKDRAGYVFPQQYMFLIAPFYYIAGVPGIYLMNHMFGIILLYILFASVETFLDRHPLGYKGKNGILVVTGSLFVFGSGMLVYMISAYEHIVTTLLVVSGVLLFGRLFFEDGGSRLPDGLERSAHDSIGKKGLLFRMIGNGRHLYGIGSGFLIGLSCFFRMESAVILPLMGLAFLMFYKGSFREKMQLLFPLVLSFLLIFLLNFWINQILTGNILGLRGVEFEKTAYEGVASRLFRVYEYLVGRHGYGTLFLETPVFLLSFVVFWKFRKGSGPTGGWIRYLCFLAIGYSVGIPFLFKVPPYMEFGERYLLNVYPIWILLIVVGAASIENKYASRTYLGIALILAAYTARNMYRYIDRGNKFLHGMEKEAQKVYNITRMSRVIFLRNSNLNTFFLFDPDPGKIYFLADTDYKLMALVSLLKRKKIDEFTVIHTRLRGDNLVSPEGDRFDIRRTMVPPEFKYSIVSEDEGDAFVEIRNYKF